MNEEKIRNSLKEGIKRIIELRANPEIISESIMKHIDYQKIWNKSEKIFFVPFAIIFNSEKGNIEIHIERFTPNGTAISMIVKEMISGILEKYNE